MGVGLRIDFGVRASINLESAGFMIKLGNCGICSRSAGCGVELQFAVSVLPVVLGALDLGELLRFSGSICRGFADECEL